MPYRAIIFDMGDIFFDATAWRRAMTAHLQGLGVQVDYPTYCRRWEAKLVDVYLGRRPYWEALAELMTDFGLDATQAEAAIAFARQKAATVEKRTLFDGVDQTLGQLKQRGVKLAVLSDTESHEPVVRRRLAQLGIEQHFDAVVTSIDIGHVKPQPEAFAAALAKLGTKAAETIFVGHDIDELDGAMRCGLTAVAFNHEPGVEANRHIARFSELLNVAAGHDHQDRSA
ncbi:MAG: HAD family hydrolase [Planctomycetaceae bacterium]|nr:HAD family hydrolase [Planctomycetaceae bacterium]